MAASWEDLNKLIYKLDLCSGCGICAGVCPEQKLEMVFNKFGEYKPERNGTCNKCGVCYNVCPFVKYLGSFSEKRIDQSKNNETHYNEQVGHYEKCLVGYTTQKIREQSASGGLLTWLLIQLMQTKKIDYAICVKPAKEPYKKYKYTICKTVEEIKECSSSCYYPVEASNVIKKVIEKEGRYAIVALPCTLKALKNTAQYYKKVEKRIIFQFGLVCGQQKNKQFVDYIALLSGGNPKCIDSIRFRIKDNDRSALDYGVGLKYISNKKNSFDKTVFWTEGIRNAWCNGYFKLNACNFCDDFFAELSDVSFMDAWLPQYWKDPKGTSIIIVRNGGLLEMFENGNKDGSVYTENIGIDQVILSQKGTYDHKINKLPDRIAHSKAKFRNYIQRYYISLPKLSLCQKNELELQFNTTKYSKIALYIQKKVSNNLMLFKIMLVVLLFPDKINRKILRFGTYLKNCKKVKLWKKMFF